jgi:protein dithiol oxidoreductase (disulfide-forming)
MKRREFSATAAATVAASGLAVLGLPLGAVAQTKPPQEGIDYLVLDKPQATEAPKGQIEVVEFFWYSCPHCNQFEPQLEEWIKRKPKDVAVRRVPVAFRDNFEPQQRLYYTLEALGKLADLHPKVFYAIHVEKNALATEDAIAAWAVKQGLPRPKFTEMYNSFAVSTKARKATQLQNAFKVEGVPALGVAGLYYTDATLAKSMGQALLVAEYLIGITRKRV